MVNTSSEYFHVLFYDIKYISKGHCNTESEIFACVFPFFHIPHPFLSKCMLRMRKRRKSNLIRIYFWRTKVSEAVCKCDWHNVRSYLFFNVRKFQTQCAVTLMLALKMAVVNKCLNGLIEVVGTLNIIKLNYRRFYSLIVFIIVLLQTILTQIVRENVFKIKTVRVNVVTLKSCKHVVCYIAYV